MTFAVKKTAKILGMLFLIACILLIVLSLLIYMNRFTLCIAVEADREQTLEFGDTYVPPDAKVLLTGTYFLQDGIPLQDIPVTLTGQVDDQMLGIYKETYKAEFLFWGAETERTVYVVDTVCPVIELTEGSGETILPGQVYEEPGYRAVDNVDGDITDRVIRMEEAGVITYAVIDSSGNPGIAQREIPYYDPEPPVITLEEGERYTLSVGRAFAEPGYSAMDNADGDLTDAVTVEGEVDSLVPGIYPITYRVQDTFGNETVITREVEVQAQPWPETQWPKRKTIYLTFDDGPGPYTQTLLNVLDRYGVKATFFVVDSGYGYLMKEIVRRGHSIGIHSVTHDYAQIYASPQAYFEDVYRMQDIIYENTGVKTTLLRFPGGGSNLISRKSCEGIMSTLTWAVREAGFQYFDWNVDSDDAGRARNKETVIDNVTKGIYEAGTSIVLQHDIHAYSVDAVETIIRWGRKNGYEFRKIEPTTPGFHHDVLN